MDKTKDYDTEENPMTTILVTGASGFIGSRVVKRLLAATGASNGKIRCMSRNPELLSSYFQEGNERLELFMLIFITIQT